VRFRSTAPRDGPKQPAGEVNAQGPKQPAIYQVAENPLNNEGLVQAVQLVPSHALPHRPPITACSDVVQPVGQMDPQRPVRFKGARIQADFLPTQSSAD